MISESGESHQERANKAAAAISLRLGRMEGAMAAESLVQMLEEIAVGLKAGDEEIYGWLREQLKECGASEISVELAMGVIARLLPEEAQGNLEAAQQHARRWAH
jgi:precorrin-4 methylase